MQSEKNEIFSKRQLDIQFIKVVPYWVEELSVNAPEKTYKGTTTSYKFYIFKYFDCKMVERFIYDLYIYKYQTTNEMLRWTFLLKSYNESFLLLISLITVAFSCLKRHCEKFSFNPGHLCTFLTFRSVRLLLIHCFCI